MNLGDFARRIRRRGRELEERALEVKRKVAVVASQTVTMATPVDTGRARANWDVSLGAPSLSVKDEVDPSGGSTVAKNTAEAMAAGKDQDVYITNNLDYIGRLNDGWSAQAPAGFVEAGVEAAAAHVRASKLVR